jgi:hypothetical protein
MGLALLALIPVAFVVMCVLLVAVGQHFSGDTALPPEPKRPRSDLDDPTTGDEMRAGDGDRSAAVEILQAGVEAGRLTPTECDERVQAATASRTLGELRAQLTDLPHTTEQ